MTDLVQPYIVLLVDPRMTEPRECFGPFESYGAAERFCFEFHKVWDAFWEHHQTRCRLMLMSVHDGSKVPTETWGSHREFVPWIDLPWTEEKIKS